MKPLVIALAALLLSSSGCSRAPAQEPPTAASPAAPIELAQASVPELADLLDPAPADVTPADAVADAAPSAEEVAAFRAPVPK